MRRGIKGALLAALERGELWGAMGRGDRDDGAVRGGEGVGEGVGGAPL
jgi:hypothetical protein